MDDGGVSRLRVGMPACGERVLRDVSLRPVTEEHRSPGLWIVRAVVGAALVITLWLAGPQAYTVLAARVGTALRDAGPSVAISQVGVLGSPDWLEGPVLERVLFDLEPVLRGRLGWYDEAGIAELKRLAELSPWVRSAVLRRREPGQFALDLDLRRPLLGVVSKSHLVALLDRDACVLPVPRRRPELPIVDLPEVLVESTMARGEVCADPMVVVAAHVAAEWMDQVLPRLAAGASGAASAPPRLLQIDANNLGGRFLADPHYSEVVVALEAADGATVWAHYGRAESDGGPVAAETKAWVLGQILADHPGLRGLGAIDLRLRNRWRDCLVARVGASPGSDGRDPQPR